MHDTTSLWPTHFTHLILLLPTSVPWHYMIQTHYDQHFWLIKIGVALEAQRDSVARFSVSAEVHDHKVKPKPCTESKWLVTTSDPRLFLRPYRQEQVVVVCYRRLYMKWAKEIEATMCIKKFQGQDRMIHERTASIASVRSSAKIIANYWRLSVAEEYSREYQ